MGNIQNECLLRGDGNIIYLVELAQNQVLVRQKTEEGKEKGLETATICDAPAQ